MLDLHWTPADDRTSLSWRKINALAAFGEIEIGSHACSHPQLTDLSLTEVRRELSASRRALVASIGERFIPCLAYLYGAFSETIAQETLELRYSSALTTDPGSNSSRTDLLRLRRAVVHRFDTIDVFAARVSGLVGWLRVAQAILRRFAAPATRFWSDSFLYTPPR